MLLVSFPNCANLSRNEIWVESVWLPDSHSTLTVSFVCTHTHPGVTESNSCTGAVVAAVIAGVIGGVAVFILVAVIVVVVIQNKQKQKKGMRSKFR